MLEGGHMPFEKGQSILLLAWMKELLSQGEIDYPGCMKSKC